MAKRNGQSGWLNFRADEGLEEKIEETVKTLQEQGVPGVSRASVIRILLRRALGMEDGVSVTIETLTQLHARAGNALRFAMIEVGKRLPGYIDDQANAE